MSDEEVEKFEITDYDLENEFNINRPGRRVSKNEQIYGKFFITLSSTYRLELQNISKSMNVCLLLTTIRFLKYR
jgi:hypothetical protein